MTFNKMIAVLNLNIRNFYQFNRINEKVLTKIEETRLMEEFKMNNLNFNEKLALAEFVFVIYNLYSTTNFLISSTPAQK